MNIAKLTSFVLFLAGYNICAQSNEIVTENALNGNPSSEWDVVGAGDLTIQGFATDISVNRGGTVYFKVDTDASGFTIDIYRLGYYQGNGARYQGSGVITASLPQAQPEPVYDAPTGLTDCGNWEVSGHWDVPDEAVSGIYIAKLTRTDTDGSSHIVFIVRDDAGTSDLLFKTSDATWQAYNGYGGNSLYVTSIGVPGFNHATKVSYNRPFYTRGGGGGSSDSEDWLFNAEYPMIRWLERNGYDVSYTTDLDMARDASSITPSDHRVLLSVGHDEYWCAAERTRFEEARAAGVHLAFFSGNEVYWKTRWEPSIDGSATDYRTLVCYKEGTMGENICGTKCDPLANVWTGLWRSGCDYPDADGCNPENALTGQISWQGSTASMQVPSGYKDHRFWRNTTIATLGNGEIKTLPYGTLGYEWDWEQYDAYYPPARMLLSQTTLGGRTHKMSLYRHESGALVFGAGTVQWSWGLDGVHDRGNEPPSADMQQATVNLFADMGVQPGTLQGDLIAATASSDVTPALSVITDPIQGAEFPANSPVIISGTASDAEGSVAGVDLSFDGGSTWQTAVGTTAWTCTWIPMEEGAATILTRAFDDSGNREDAGSAPAANAVDVLITPAVAPECPCSIWDPSTLPANITEPDPNSYELGVKFRATENGYITGVRFYKSASNTGTHIGNLWSASGVNLAQATFINETASGWQQVTFGTPVAITAGVTYVASYHTTAGYYSQDYNYFTTAPYTTYYLEALQDGSDGPNGVYAASGTSTFPSTGHQESNYWVDVVFNTSVEPDVTPPLVVSTAPADGSPGVSVYMHPSANFNELLDPTTVNTSSMLMAGPGSVPVPGTVSLAGATATFTPTSPLEYNTTYSVTLVGGYSEDRIKDLAGNGLSSDHTWTFTTSDPPPPPPTDGPGGPILVISSVSNPFSRYPVEILRAEGFNEFFAMDISELGPTTLDDYDIVILGDFAITAAFVTTLTSWVEGGGTLIALRPDPQLAPLLGLTALGTTLNDQYLLIETGSGPGVGLVNETIQFHSTADLYDLNGATSLATLYSDATTATTHPAVTQRDVGDNGGAAFAFTYDLARSVVYTRQGNPSWANQKRDGAIDPIRSDDLFYGNASFDPQPDWIDFDKVHIPQADEQQHLLSNIMTMSNLHNMPLPRFWFLPKGLKAAVVMTGDDHGDAGMVPRFEKDILMSEEGCSVDDWECVRSTGYLYVGSSFTDALAQHYTDLGFEVAMHVNTNCQVYTAAQFENFITTQMAGFNAAFPSIPSPSTNRNHCIAWSGYTTTAEVEAAHGIRLDVNYYYWPNSWTQNLPGMFTGSGMPMRFATTDGTIVDCYQVTTQMQDETQNTPTPYPSFCNALLDKAVGPEGYYGVFATNMHFDYPDHPGANAIVASAQARGVPVVSAKQMLDWLDGRNGSSFLGLTWDANELSFTVTVGDGALNLRGMVPVISGVGTLLGLTRDGSPVSTTTEVIKGISYAFFPAEAGDYVAVYGIDDLGPVITDVTATPNPDGSVTVTWTTDEPSSSVVEYGLVADPLDMTVSDDDLVTAHGITMQGLAANTTYFYRVSSADAFANSTTEPLPPAAPLEVTTVFGICAEDISAADFSLGTPGDNTLVVSDNGGGVILMPALHEDFSASVLPEGWGEGNFSTGTTTFSGGQVTVSGTHIYSNTTFGPGTSLEFVATFNQGTYQNLGFSVDQAFSADPWVTIGQGGTAAGELYARAYSGGAVDISLGTGLLGTPHKFRIQWNADNFEFYLDDSPTPAATISLTIATNLYIQISDYTLDAGTLSVDWVRASPYAAAGSFLSRSFDQGSPGPWGEISWTSEEPPGTSLSTFVRTGNTSSPDGTWTDFYEVGHGATVGGSHQYLQYRADLATSAGALTPVLEDMSVACGLGPAITNVQVLGLAATSATIAWTTEVPASSVVNYGTDPLALTGTVSEGTLKLSHSLPITGLSSGTTIFFRITSADADLNGNSEPAALLPPAEFTTTSVCAEDITAADFILGTTDENTLVVLEGDGGVMLKPELNEEFSGATLPDGWGEGNFGDGTTTFSGGQVTVSGTHLYSSGAFGPGTSIEFVATFNLGTYQNVGLSADQPFSIGPWVTIGQGGTATGDLYARAYDGGPIDISLGAGLLGTPHKFRIQWNDDNFEFYVDDSPAPAATINLTISADLYIQISDYTVDAGTLSVDWLRTSPYPTDGIFLSRVFDQGSQQPWGEITWNSAEPEGTSLTLMVSAGNTAVPDETWTGFLEVTNGMTIGGSYQYLRYQAGLSTTESTLSPILKDLAISCATGPDETPPVITNVSAVPDISGGSAIISWDTDEASTTMVSYGTDPATLSELVSDEAFLLSHSIDLTGLVAGTTYYYRVTSADLSMNAATEPVPDQDPLEFTTPVPAVVCFSDQDYDDFAGGTTSGTYLVISEDGVILDPAAASEFATEPPAEEWLGVAWVPGGTTTVSGGSLHVNGARYNSQPLTLTFGPGDFVEFMATFNVGVHQHIGFGGGTDIIENGGMFNAFPWAIFSTGTSGTSLQARVAIQSGTMYDYTLPGSYLGTAHLYKIEWLETGFNFYIDGSLVHNHPVAVSEPMRVGMSDYFATAPELTVDWVRVSPYDASGEFESRVHDAGDLRKWAAADWTADIPEGTALQFYQRQGNTSVPDEGWTSYSLIPNKGDLLGGISRYIQYKAVFSTTDGNLTPELNEFHVNCEEAVEVQLDLKAFLQGAFQGSEMLTSLNAKSAVPLSQPYGNSPWDYDGTEVVTELPSADIVDWVLVEVRGSASGPSGADPGTRLARAAGFLLKDGSVVGIDGTSYLKLNVFLGDELYAVLWHRNHLPVLSSAAMLPTGDVYSYDFTTGEQQVYGGAAGHKELAEGTWGLASGDGNGDGLIDNTDHAAVWMTEAGTGGYKASDFNLDGEVDNADKNEIWLLNNGSASQVPE